MTLWPFQITGIHQLSHLRSDQHNILLKRTASDIEFRRRIVIGYDHQFWVCRKVRSNVECHSSWTITQIFSSRPVVFAFGSPDSFTANFVMSTLPPDDSSQADRSVTRSVPKEKEKPRRNDKSLRNHSESTIMTLNLSEVVDLDANGDVPVPVPTTVTRFNYSFIPAFILSFYLTNADDDSTATIDH